MMASRIRQGKRKFIEIEGSACAGLRYVTVFVAIFHENEEMATKENTVMGS